MTFVPLLGFSRIFAELSRRYDSFTGTYFLFDFETLDPRRHRRGQHSAQPYSGLLGHEDRQQATHLILSSHCSTLSLESFEGVADSAEGFNGGGGMASEDGGAAFSVEARESDDILDSESLFSLGLFSSALDDLLSPDASLEGGRCERDDVPDRDSLLSLDLLSSDLLSSDLISSLPLSRDESLLSLRDSSLRLSSFSEPRGSLNEPVLSVRAESPRLVYGCLELDEPILSYESFLGDISSIEDGRALDIVALRSRNVLEEDEEAGGPAARFENVLGGLRFISLSGRS